MVTADDFRSLDFTFAKATFLNQHPNRNQVVFSSTEELPLSMSWQYSNPRTICRVRTSPIPLHLDGAVEDACDVQECRLEYFDDAKRRFVPLTTFNISAIECFDVEVGDSTAACIWRVQLQSTTLLAMNSEVLGGCVRISSRERLDLSPKTSVVRFFLVSY
jgi:hypothetical protein